MRNITLPAVYLCLSLLCGPAALGQGDGAKLHYEVSGKGRTVVLIHGGLVDSRMWDDQYKEFARRYRVVRYDLRGFGGSEFPTKPFSHVEDLYALLKHLKVDKATVVGLSLGGMIAVDFALEHPEMVDGLVLAASGLRGYQYKAVGNRQAIFEAAGGGNVEKAVALWMDDPVFASTKKYPAVERRARTMLTDNFKAWTSIPPTLLTWPARPSVERLSTIRVPTLVVVGDRDNPNILGVAQLLEDRVAGAKKMILRGAGHHLNMEKPKEFNKAVLDFLKRGGGR